MRQNLGTPLKYWFGSVWMILFVLALISILTHQLLFADGSYFMLLRLSTRQLQADTDIRSTTHLAYSFIPWLLLHYNLASPKWVEYVFEASVFFIPVIGYGLFLILAAGDLGLMLWGTCLELFLYFQTSFFSLTEAHFVTAVLLPLSALVFSEGAKIDIKRFLWIGLLSCFLVKSYEIVAFLAYLLALGVVLQCMIQSRKASPLFWLLAAAVVANLLRASYWGFEGIIHPTYVLGKAHFLESFQDIFSRCTVWILSALISVVVFQILFKPLVRRYLPRGIPTPVWTAITLAWGAFWFYVTCAHLLFNPVTFHYAARILHLLGSSLFLLFLIARVRFKIPFREDTQITRGVLSLLIAMTLGWKLGASYEWVQYNKSLLATTQSHQGVIVVPPYLEKNPYYWPWTTPSQMILLALLNESSVSTLAYPASRANESFPFRLKPSSRIPRIEGGPSYNLAGN